MESANKRKDGGIGAALEDLRRQIDEYLSYDPTAKSSTDNFLWSGGKTERPPIPAAYSMYLALTNFAGRSGNAPMMWAGGYLDQPWLTMRILQVCSEAEADFTHRQYLAAARALAPKDGAPNSQNSSGLPIE